MFSSIRRRETSGGLSVKTETSVIVQITQDEDRCTALSIRADPMPLRCLVGITDTGASANAGNGASILDSRT